MKLGVVEPTLVVDVGHLPLADVERLPNGTLRVGAEVRNSDLAAHPVVRSSYPVLARALLSVKKACRSAMSRSSAARVDRRLAARTASFGSRDVMGHVDASPCQGLHPKSGAKAPTTGSSTSR